MQASLQVAPVRGRPPYEYEWLVTDPAGSPANNLLESIEGPSTHFTAGELDGPYEVSCTIKDACSREYTTRLVLRVGGSIGLNINTERVGVVAGGGLYGQTTIRLNPSSGMPPFEVSWTCTGPDGKIDDDRLDTTDPMMPVFTSGDQVGVYILTASITDAAGESSVESVVVIVGETPGLDVTVDRTSVMPGGGIEGMAELLATPIGGRAPYLYDWEVIDPQGTTRNDLLWDAEVRSPVFESPDEAGVYLVRCAVTDAETTVFIGSTSIIVNQQLSVHIDADRLALPVGGATDAEATLTADTRGGTAPLNIEWEVTGPRGQDRTYLLDQIDEEQATLVPGPVPGSYLVRCIATDADGVPSTDSLVITVGGTLGLVVTTDRTSLASGGSALYGSASLSVEAYGGEPPYSYRWSVVDPSGEDAPSSIDGAASETPTFTSSSTIGLHSVMCTVTDVMGNIAVDSASISVGQPLNADVTVDKQSLVANGGVSGQAQLVTTVHGGSAPYSYNWTVFDSSGLAASSRLSSTTMAAPVFTSSTAPDTYRLTLTTTDAMGVVFVDSVAIVVSGADSGRFSVDVSTSRQTVAPSGGTASLTAIATGGVTPISYQWTITDPSGGTDNNRLDSTSDSTVTFTSDSTQGTYRALCTATDAAGNTFTDSTQLTVSNTFTLDLSADVTHVSPGGTANLLADRSGGNANFTYSWSCVDDSGVAAGAFAVGSIGTGAALQVDTDDATNVWTAPAGGPSTLGSYRILVVATDATGRSFTDSVMINVTDAFLLDVSASAVHVAPGGSTTLTANRTGGSANFTYTFSCVDTGGTLAGAFTTGATSTGAATIVASDDTVNVWTAPPAGVGTLGTYRLTVSATEVGGAVFTDTVHIVVADPFSLNITASDPMIAPGGSTALTADRAGGETTFSYVWTAVDSAGAPAGSFTAGSTGVGTATQSGEADDAANTWTAPADVADIYTISCVATDALGSIFTDSVHVAVGADSTVTLNVTADSVFVLPGTVVNLTANQTGGVGTFDYAYTATNESGASAGSFGAASQTGITGDTTNTWTAPAAAAGTLGTYRIAVTVTDSVGDTFTDSVQIIVSFPLSLNLSSTAVYVAPSTVITLTADLSGGEQTYGLTWLAKNSVGTSVGTFTTGAGSAGTATQSGQTGDTTNGWSVATEGNYTITCTVADNAGQTFTDSVSVIVTSQEVFSLNITADKHVVAPGEVINLAGDRTGGIANFNYSWSILNEAGASAGTLGSASQTGVASDTTNTWTAPTGTGVEGTYRIICTITDASGRTFTDGVIVEVSTLALQNVFLAPAAINTSSVLAGTALNAWTTFGDPGQQISAGLHNPVYPRNVVITINDADNSITGGTARVTGLDARGLAASEVISIAASAGASSTNTGILPFATVTRIDLFSFTGTDAGADQVVVGMGDKFGLTGILEASGDVAYVIEDGTVMTSGYTVVATAGQQSITFANAPNGARNYTVIFRAR